VRVVGIVDVVDLQAGVEVGEIDVPVVRRQAVEALLLVLVVGPNRPPFWRKLGAL